MSSVLNIFQNFRQILCLCPSCKDIIRFSDLHLKYMGKVKKTWLDDQDYKRELLQGREERFLEKEKELRKNAIAIGRKKAEAVFNKAISREFKNLGLDPYDVKPVLHPIDFLVFKGMNERDVVDEILFLSNKCRSRELNSIRNSVKNVISKKQYEWNVARVDEAGKIKFE